METAVYFELTPDYMTLVKREDIFKSEILVGQDGVAPHAPFVKIRVIRLV